MEKWMLWGIALLGILVVMWRGHRNRNPSETPSNRQPMSEHDIKLATAGLQPGQARQPTSSERLAQALGEAGQKGRPKGRST